MINGQKVNHQRGFRADAQSQSQLGVVGGENDIAACAGNLHLLHGGSESVAVSNRDEFNGHAVSSFDLINAFRNLFTHQRVLRIIKGSRGILMLNNVEGLTLGLVVGTGTGIEGDFLRRRVVRVGIGVVGVLRTGVGVHRIVVTSKQREDHQQSKRQGKQSFCKFHCVLPHS